MSYRAPALCFLHALRKAGGSAVTVSSEAAGFPKARLLDNRTASLFKFAAAAANLYVQVDRGATTPEAIDRLLIPSGHNLSGASVAVLASATGAFAGEESSLASWTAGAGLIDQALTSSTARYIRFRIATSGQWEIGEIVFTRTRTPSRGPEPRWTVDVFPNQVQTRMRSGEVYGLVIGPEATAYRIRLFGVSSADKLIFDELWAEVGAHSPFYFVPPDTADPVLWARLRTGLSREQDHANPNGSDGPTYVYAVELEEALG